MIDIVMMCFIGSALLAVISTHERTEIDSNQYPQTIPWRSDEGDEKERGLV
jgi:hypothetical protein